VDHPDGLFDPAGYFARLQDSAGRALAEGNVEWAGALSGGGLAPAALPLYVVAEKILSRSEQLRPDWAVYGTTGYNFLSDLSGIFVDAANGERLRRIYRRFSGHRDGFSQVAHDAKKLIMTTSMASELNVLAHALNRLSEANWRTRDFTLNALRKALLEVIACFPVYRTYVARAGSSPEDRAAVELAIARARRRNPAMEFTIFSFLRDVLVPDDARGMAALPENAERFAFAMKFQQYSGPVHAKGVEDTAFYRYSVLLSLNEVGGHPERFATTVDEFHEANQHRLAHWPLEMLATSTHDTKRGEDARARINVLSEMPETWRRAVSTWMRINAGNRTRVEGEPAPDRSEEYFFYQALVGAWPAEDSSAPTPATATEALAERLCAYVDKGLKEAKLHTSWINPNQAYDRAVELFVRRCLAGPGAPKFLAAFIPFQRAVARAGAVNSFGQVVLKLAAPGVPDIYRGCELWDLNLVDPDNRRPVDFALRGRLLNELKPLLSRLEAEDGAEPGAGGSQAVREDVGAMLSSWTDARLKLFLTARGLRLRAAHADLLRRGEYLPLVADEVGARHVVAFARRREGEVLLAAATRLSSQMSDATPFPLGTQAWKTSRLLLPDDWNVQELRNLATGERVAVHLESGTRWVAVADLFRTLPVGWFWGDLRSA
jgi:(1->4)-alpha-D-glucan 1-alpha-D-glucosylmutase